MANTITPVLAINMCEPPGNFGPFAFGGSLFFVGYTVVSNTVNLHLYKSTDGITWIEQDAANNAQAAVTAYTCVQLGSILWLIYTGLDGQFNLASFDLTNPMWMGGYAETVTNSAQIVRSNLVAVAYGVGFLVACPGDIVSVNNVNHVVPAFSVYDVTGNTWAPWQDLDYDNSLPISDWALLPTGIAVDPSGRVIIVSQQITILDLQTPVVITYEADDTFTVPDDCDSIDVVCVGGGGAAGQISVSAQGGGGSGGTASATFAVVAGTPYSIVVGQGGTVPGGHFAPGTAGGASTFGSGGTTVTAQGGDPNGGGDGATGGGGGAGGNNGLNGGATDGGNGGASPDGTAGGIGGASTGKGTSGLNGSGAGGCGNDFDSSMSPIDWTGGNGYVTVTYTPIRDNAVLGKLRVQCVAADGTLLAAQTLAPEFPIQLVSSTGLTRACDLSCSASGAIRLAVSGLTGDGYDSIELWTATPADVPTFAFSNTIATGNGGSNSDPVIKFILNGADWFLGYWSAPAPPNANLIVLMNGTAFASSPAAIAGGGIQGVFTTKLQMLLGTPTQSTASFEGTG